jgi:hypothetical protein
VLGGFNVGNETSSKKSKERERLLLAIFLCKVKAAANLSQCCLPRELVKTNK